MTNKPQTTTTTTTRAMDLPGYRCTAPKLHKCQCTRITLIVALGALVVYILFPLKMTVVYEGQVEFLRKSHDQTGLGTHNTTRNTLHMAPRNITGSTTRKTRHGLEYKVVYYDHRPHWVPTSAFRSCDHVCTFSATNMTSADAVVFNNNNLLYRKRPPDKSRDQIWVFHSREPPTMIHSFRQWKGLFNWTMSFRRDADVHDPFARFYPKTARNKSDGSSVKETVQIWKKKTKNISWLVSNCRYASSKRMDYVVGLKRFTDVDIIGKCGRLDKRCREPENWRTCVEPYKFYLAFENSLCRDYITEKAFRMYTANLSTIPITRGTLEESIFLPPMSFVSTSDFPDSISLVNYMRALNYDDENIRTIFWWKDVFRVEESMGFCQLCRRLHHADRFRGVYADIDAWIKMPGQCRVAKDMTT